MSSSKSELSTVQRSQITVGIICALPCELAAVILMFDRRYSRLTDQAAGDDNIYTCGRIGDHDVAVAQMGSYGLVSAAEVAKALMVTFTSSLKIGLMIGVGGGLPTKSNDIRLGDVVVGKPEGSHGGVFQFDMGRHLQGGKFEHTGHLNRPPEILLKALSTTLANHLLETPTYVEHIRRVRHSMPPHAPWHKPQQDQLFDATVKHNPTEDDCGDCDANKLVERIPRVYEYPRLHAGLIASSNSVVKDAIIRDKLRKETTALCFEMEAAGLMQSFPCLIIRGISDYSDSHKNKAWQPYAALAAAAFGKELLGLVPLTGLREMKNAAEIEALSSEVHSLVESVDQTAASLQQMRLDAEERAQRRETDNSVRAEHAAIRMFHTSTYQESKDLIKPRAPDTCLWALKHTLYEEWINAEAGSLLWISADPGCGKSVLMKTIVEEDLPGRFTTPEELTICYYFFRENSGHAKLHVALCAVLHQIFKTQPIMMRHAKKELQLENTHFLQEPETLFRILDRILGDEAVGPIVCAFDALDECESGDKDRLLSWLCDARRQSGRVKIPVSSRPYEEIERRFRQSSSVSQIRIRGETENEALNREIDQVIHSATMNFASEVELSSEIVSAILRKLLAMRNRTYLWLKLAFEYIKDALRYRKDVAVINMLPSSVADAYEQMLQRRVPEVGRELVDHIFSLMIAADGPLTVWEMQVSLVLLSKKCRTLQEAEAKQFLTMRDVVGSIRKWCGLLVFVQDDRFFFLHQTVKEFLLASHSGTDTSDSNAWFRHISQAHAHATLTRVSIRYIVLEDMPRLFRQQVPVIWRRSQNGVNFRHELQVTELKRELALYWKAVRWWPTSFSECYCSCEMDLLEEVVEFYCYYDELQPLRRELMSENVMISVADLALQWHPIPLACMLGHVPVVRRWLDGELTPSGASNDAPSTSIPLLWTLSSHLFSTTSETSAAARYSMVEMLLHAGHSPNVSDRQGRTPLHFAAFSKDVASCKLLLEFGANPDSKTTTSEGDTPCLQLFSRCIRLDAVKPQILRLFAAFSANLELCNQRQESLFKHVTHLPWEASDTTEHKWAAQCVELILQHAPKSSRRTVTDFSFWENTLPYHSDWLNCEPFLQYLLQNMEHVSEQGQLLSLLAKSGDGRLVKRFLSLPCEVTAASRKALNNAVSLAARCGHLQVMKQLVSSGACLTPVIGEVPELPIHAAILSRSIQVFEYVARSYDSSKALPPDCLARTLYFGTKFGVDKDLGCCTAVLRSLLARGERRGSQELLQALINKWTDGYRESLFGRYRDNRIRGILEEYAEAAELLVQYNMPHEVVLPWKEYALHVACAEGAVTMVESLLAEAADCNLRSPLHGSTIAAAAHAGSNFKAILNVLMQQGAKIDTESSSEVYAAAASGSSSAICALIEMGAPINRLGGPLGSPLHLAAVEGKVGVLNTLLKHGADINFTVAITIPLKGMLHDITALDICLIQNTADEIVFDLLKHGARPTYNGCEGGSLYIASRNARYFQMRTLLNFHAPINSEGCHGQPLHALMASEYYNAECVELLLERGADINAIGSLGTPLHINVLSDPSRKAYTRILLARGADIEASWVRGTPLQLTVLGMRDLQTDGWCSDLFVHKQRWEKSKRGKGLLPSIVSSIRDQAEMLLDAGADLHLDGPNGSACEMAHQLDDCELKTLILERCQASGKCPRLPPEADAEIARLEDMGTPEPLRPLNLEFFW